MFETRIISDPGELAAIAPEWRRLWRRCPDATVFQSPDWLLAWWGEFSPGELMSVTVFGDGHLLGLAPLYLEAGPCGPRLLPLGISLSDYVDVLIEPGLELPVGEALLQALMENPCWKLIEWSELHPRATALQLQAPGPCTITEEVSSPCPVLALLDPSRGHSLPASKRRKVRMAGYRADRMGSVQFIEADETSAAFLFDALVHLHRARWRSRDQGGVLCDPRVLLFHKRLLPALVRTGIVQLHALQIGGEIAAVYYGFEDRGRAYAYLGGFDPQRAFASPGTLLLAHVIMKSCRSGLQEFHFLRGSEAYKLEWGAQIRHNRCRTLRRVQAPCNA